MAVQTITHTFSAVVGSGGTASVNKTIDADNIAVLFVKVEPSILGGAHTFEIFQKDTLLAADLSYKASGFSGDFFDPVEDVSGTPTERTEGFVTAYQDDDSSLELHIKITNDDTSTKNFDITIRYVILPTGNITSTGTPLNNQLAIWTNANTLEGDADLTFNGTQLALATLGVTGGVLIGGDVQWYRSAANVMRTPDDLEVDGQILLQDGTAANPSIGFKSDDDGTGTGFYRVGVDQIGVTVGGTEQFQWFSTGFRATNTNGPQIINALTSSTIPVLIPRRSDPNTGIGSAGADLLSLITGGVECLQISNTGAEFTITGSRLVFGGAAGTDQSIRYRDSTTQPRLVMTFDSTNDLVVLQNRAVNGVVEIRANTATGGSGGEVTVAEFQDDQITLLASGGNLLITGAANGQTLTIKTATTTLTMTGASQTATNLIPAGSFVVGITTRVTTLVTGPAGYDVGDGTDVDRWGNSILVALSTTSDITDFISSALTLFPAANNVVITSDGVNFVAGVIRVTVHYISLTAPTS